ncbi:zinc finger protein 62 homolog [Cephus cinctus]|uniref:Zinc finger protein 62 homolog n=1 Tax=Cephus cinctus TaxID=211228 RepID=A0AAJ7C6R2_CEPCN|nr:zinc finger protein 62 homolog [Cephus cinctus]
MEEMEQLRNVEDLCRLCLSVDQPKSSVFRGEDSSVSLATKIEACLSIEISQGDKLSTTICTECVTKVNQWHAYKESCLRSQDKLQEWLARQTSSELLGNAVKEEPEKWNYDPWEDNSSVQFSELSETDSNYSRISCTNDQEHSEEKTSEDVNGGSKCTELLKDMVNAEVLGSSSKEPVHKEQIPLKAIKKEPLSNHENDTNVEVAPVPGGELLLNPLAINKNKPDMVMEADSTQKSTTAAVTVKRKVRRGPHTHYRGHRVFKQKCSFCQIHLHSKFTYAKHMAKFHSDADNVQESQNAEAVEKKVKALPSQKTKTITDVSGEVEEMIEDVEEEIDMMDQNSSLSQVQQSIISQLKTFSCYSCQLSFPDRRSTLYHIREHMPDLRPYTCVACLTEFPDRSTYQSHCGASVECAMKIALVVPTMGIEKLFTCNMCLRPLNNRKELLSHLSKHSDKQYAKLTTSMSVPPKLKPISLLTTEETNTVSADHIYATMPHPYKNGDPAFNHECNFCGMIYRYKPNMLKHRDICKRLPPDARTVYKCVHCGMTFRVFKKFHSHTKVKHKKREFVCSKCYGKFRSPRDYLSHHESHTKVTSKNERYVETENGEDVILDNKETRVSRINDKKYNCGMCDMDFGSRSELTKHKNVHLKVKIYSCVICRSMFSSAGALEIHMKEHGIEDPRERKANSSCVEYRTPGNGEHGAGHSTNSSGIRFNCDSCIKSFSNLANLRRHIRNAHTPNEVFKCPDCLKVFSDKTIYEQHAKAEHKSSRPSYQCIRCTKIFALHANLALHVLNVHENKLGTRLQCDICGKKFIEETSLRIHKGWHARANCRLNADKFPDDAKRVKIEAIPVDSLKPAKARKSLPSVPTTRQVHQFQCYVCHENFREINRLKVHLQDVHHADSKDEKSHVNKELHCQLCTSVFPDNDSLQKHMKWHKENPISSAQKRKNFQCDVCGKYYTLKKSLARHKKLHKATAVVSLKLQSLARKQMAAMYQCPVCRKVFDTYMGLQRHKVCHGSESSTQKSSQSARAKRTSVNMEHEDLRNPKIELDDSPEIDSLDNSGARKPVTCILCKKVFPGMSTLLKHKQTAHNIRYNRQSKQPKVEFIPILQRSGRVGCNLCPKEFPTLPRLKQHFTLIHKSEHSGCTAHCCDPSNATVSKTKKKVHGGLVVFCKLCEKHFDNKPDVVDHLIGKHRCGGDFDKQDKFFSLLNLDTYVVNGANGTICPTCNIKYPNLRSLKIHYFKFHDCI